MMQTAERTGWILLEVLVALVVIGISSAALAVLMRESTGTVEISGAGEKVFREAEHVLTRHAFRTGQELEQSIGRWNESGYGVQISRLSSTLYQIAIFAPGSHNPLVETVVYKPIESNAE